MARKGAPYSGVQWKEKSPSCIVPKQFVHVAYLDTVAESLRPSTLSKSLSFRDDTTLPDVITNNTCKSVHLT
jgi:hypothetical protein